MPVPQRPLYSEPTVPFTFRISEHQRGLLDYLAGRSGTTAGHYMRAVFEQHLKTEGYPLQRGTTAVLDPDRDTPAGWARDHSEHGERVNGRSAP